MYKLANTHSTWASPTKRAFVCTLIKKLNQVALRNRIIQRNLTSVSPLTKRSRASKQSEYEQTCPTKSFHSDPDANQEETSFPQEIWDEMYDSAFEAIQDVSFVDFFNEQ